MNLITSCVMLLMCNLEVLKTERLNPREMKKVLNLTKVVNENEMTKCKSTLEGEYFPEVPYVYLYCDDTVDPVRNEPDSTHCSGFACWESQLSLVTRVEIVRIMNQYREKVSKGVCYKWCEKNKKRLIFELLWDHDQEVNVIEIIKNCPKTLSKSDTSTVNQNGIQLNSRTDLTITSFKMETGSQQELRVILWRLMIENHLNDWNEQTSQFRRSFMFEVGCAFVVRRKINYVTALNEKVENGIVGHFGCIFHSLISAAEPPDSLDPSVSNCKSQAAHIETDFDNYNYFPNLCKIDLKIGASISDLMKPAHFCKEGPKNAKLCTSSTYYTETWEEKFYGLTLKLVNSDGLQVKADCNVPKDIPQPESFGPNTLNYNCTLKEKVTVLADTSNCPNCDCEDSQLTDITRVKILERLNEARHLVANGKCSSECPHPCKYCNDSIRYCNIAKLQWHWFLERKASQIVQKCSSEYSYRENLIYVDNPFPDPVIFDEISLVLDLPLDSRGQIALGGKMFTELFWTNQFKDWSDNNKYKRGNAVFIGCSIIVRPNVEIQNSQNTVYKGTKIHMVCIYATLQNEFISKSDSSSNTHCCATCSKPVHLTRPCQLNYVNSILPYSNLCTSVALQFTMSCQNRSICEHTGHSEAWKEEYAGTTVYQNVDGSFVGINREISKKFIVILIVLFILAILALLLLSIFLYIKRSSRRLAIYNASSTEHPIVKNSTTDIFEENQVEEEDFPKVSPGVSTLKPKPPPGVRKVPKNKAHLYQ